MLAVGLSSSRMSAFSFSCPAVLWFSSLLSHWPLSYVLACLHSVINGTAFDLIWQVTLYPVKVARPVVKMLPLHGKVDQEKALCHNYFFPGLGNQVELLVSFALYCGRSKSSQNRWEQIRSLGIFLSGWQWILLSRYLCLRGSDQLSGLFYLSSPFLLFHGMRGSGNMNCVSECHKGTECSGHIVTFRNIILKQTRIGSVYANTSCCLIMRDQCCRDVWN